MFNENFYPTPPHLIELMVKPLIKYSGGAKYIPFTAMMEPSAGKGDILDWLVNNLYKVEPHELMACEIEPELQSILQGKGYSLVESDWLAYDEPYALDLIIMNPPFSAGATHLLKAWEILHSGNIVCLLNAETIRNPYSPERKVLAALIEQHGKVEYVGQQFIGEDVERRTLVECAIVRLVKPEPESNYEWHGLETDATVKDAEFTAAPLASLDQVQALVAQYKRARTLVIERARISAELEFYTKGIIRSAGSGKQRRALNVELIELKGSFWNYVFEKMDIGKQMTSQYQREFFAKKAVMSRMAFSEANVWNVIETFIFNMDTILQQCIVQVFDTATQYHADNGVTIYPKGWKTNKAWRLNKKIIMPDGVSFDKHGWGTASGSSGNEKNSFFKDIDRALCWLSGDKLKDIDGLYDTILERIRFLNNERWDGSGRVSYRDTFESHFFTIKVHKSGTVHLLFKDLDLLARFNMAVAKGKQWVGDGS